MASRHNLPEFPLSTRHLHCIHVFDIFISEIILFFASRCIYLPDSKMEPNDRKQRIPSTDQELSSQKLLAFLKSVPVTIWREIKSSWIDDLVNFVSLHIMWHNACSFLPNGCCGWVMDGCVALPCPLCVVMINSPRPPRYQLDLSIHNVHNVHICIVYKRYIYCLYTNKHRYICLFSKHFWESLSDPDDLWSVCC